MAYQNEIDSFQDRCSLVTNSNILKHITYPVRDHRGNGKTQRLSRTINERLGTNKNIILKKDQSGSSEILYALKTDKGGRKKDI